MSFNYNPINRQQKIKEVSLCGFDDLDFKKHRKKIIETSREKTKKKRKKDYEKYRNEIKKFIKTLEILRKTEPKTIFADARFKGPQMCGKCLESQNDKYREGKDKLVCWWNKSYGSKPRKVQSDTIKKNCHGYKTNKVEILTPFFNGALELDYQRFRYAKENFARNEFDEDDCIRLAWAISGLDEKKSHFQPKWIKGILNEFDNYNFDLSLAKDAKEYEKEQRKYIKELTGGKELDKVIKYKYKNENNYHFKIMDLFLEYKNKNCIFEITKAWSLRNRNKIKQLQDYRFLLNKTKYGKRKTETVIVSKNSHKFEDIEEPIITFEEFRDKYSLGLSLSDFAG